MKEYIIKNAAKSLFKSGYAICDQAIHQINRLIDNFQPSPQQITLFDAQGKGQHRLSKYFLDSASNVSFFFQTRAWQNGKLKTSKRNSINKIGHSLHQHNQIFKNITYTSGVQQLCYQMGINKPLVTQSMAILKPPQIGGKVNIHQDSTYLYSQPDTLIGFWIPLQDATIHNGCLWGLQGSHNGKLYKRSIITDGVPKDIYYHQVDYKESDFIPLEMKKGSLAIFTGKFLHKSELNTSDKSRYAYTWHLMDESSKWSPQNWLQRQSFPKFPLKLKK